MAEITLRNIVKTYGDGFPAVNDVSLDIADGEFMILVGPSGCGKSTLLRMIVGLEDISSGDMLIGGVRVNDKAPRDRNLAMVFQNYALYPHLSVFENIAFPLRLRKNLSNDEIKEKVEKAAATLELTEHLDRKPSNLSGGQRQRVAMGRAIVRDADAFLFDEPLSNLDAKLRGQMRTEILRMQRRLGITTVYVTHDQTEAMTLGDRVALLRKGVLQQVASPRELYEQPVNMFVAGFIGSPPMNFVPARMEGTTMTLPFVSFELPKDLHDAIGDREWVMVGIRPERFEDVSLIDTDKLSAGIEFEGHVDVVEWLGNEQYAYLPYDLPQIEAQGIEEIEDDLGGEAMQPQLVVALDPASRIDDGSTAKIWFDPSRLHVFDVASGENLALAVPAST
jgi:multiple sugar transport system ATP-binding protein